jgi:hypothetical protein
MFSKIKKSIIKKIGIGSAGREVTILPDDVLIVSYPKSGNTWARFLLGNLFYKNEEITFLNIEDKVPDIYQNSNKKLLQLGTPRILKSHEYFDPRYKKVIYIVRDPRDVLISYYFHHLKFNKIDEKFNISEFARLFILGELDPFGSWGENVASWKFTRDNDAGFLLIRYEDLKSNTRNELVKVANFLGIDRSEEVINKAIDGSSVERMRMLEKQQSNVWKPLKNARRDIPFVRSAKSGSWKNELPQEVIKLIELEYEDLMKSVGYLK